MVLITSKRDLCMCNSTCALPRRQGGAHTAAPRREVICTRLIIWKPRHVEQLPRLAVAYESVQSMSQTVLQLYRAILRNGRHYPSSNRVKLIKEAKSLFHEHRDLTDPAKIRKELEQARLGLNELLIYAPKQMESDGHDQEWSVTLRGGTLPDSQSTDFLKNS